MAGNASGGKKAAQKNLARDPDFYKKIGAKGGKNGHEGGFYYSMVNGLTTHIEAGRKGGLKSRRTPSVNTIKERNHHGETL